MPPYFILYYTCVCLIVRSRSQSTPYLNEYLVHYWPLDNSDMSDIVGNAHMSSSSQGRTTYFTTDRFGNLNSALSLNGGFTQVSPGYFFDTPQFSISAWVYPDQVGNWSRLMDFGNGGDLDHVFLSLTSSSPLTPAWYTSYAGFNLFSTTPLINKKWQFLTATYNSNSLTATIYINGVFNGNITINKQAEHKLRSYNYFGKSNSNTDGYSYSYLDDLRFYNISLSQSQVVKLMRSQYLSKLFFLILRF